MAEVQERNNKFSQENINKLSPELKAVADGYLKKGETPVTALNMARSQGWINKLPDDLRKVADGFEKK